MIVYFADRQFNITGQASTQLEGGLRITEDLLTEEVATGVSTFSFKVACNDKTRGELEDSLRVGSFVLRGSSRGDSEGWYNSLFQIIETEYDTSSRELTVYAEDAGLDLINRTCSAATLSNKTIIQMIQSFIPSGWVINAIGIPSGTKSYSWDGESTATERINSVANLFDCEVYYTFTVERLKVASRILNIVPKRGNQTATAQLRLNRDINSITTKTSIADIATAYAVTGGTPSNSKNPINLKNYSYSYTDPDDGDVYRVDTATGQLRNITAMKRWASSIDTDGLIVKNFSFDTTDKATLAGQARAALQKASKAMIQYDIDFAFLPEGVQIGDRINIIDEGGELYLEARVLKLETSVTTGATKATVGDYVIKTSGINETIAQLASELTSQVNNAVQEVVESTTQDLSALEAVVSGHTETIAAQAQTLTEQGQTITQQGTTLTNLSGTVSTQGSDISNLSNAVSSQGTDLSNLSSTVSSQGTDLSNLSSTVSSQGTSISSLSSTVSTQGGDIIALTSSVEDNASEISTLSGLVSEQGTTISSQGSTIEILSTTVSDNTSDLSELSSTVAGHTTSINSQGTQIGSLSSTVSSQGTNLSNLSSTVSSQGTDLSNLSSTVDAQGANLSNLSSTVSTQGTDISNLSTTVTTHGTQLEGQSNALLDQSENLESVQLVVDEISNGLDLSNERIAGIESVCDEQDTRINSQNNSIAALEEATARQSESIAEQGSNISNLQDQTSAVAGDVDALANRASSLESDMQRVTNAIVINPAEPSITVKSGKGSVKILDDEIDIVGDGNTVARFDSTSLHSRQAEMTELTMGYIAPGESTMIGGGFILVARQNGHLSLKRRT